MSVAISGPSNARAWAGPRQSWLRTLGRRVVLVLSVALLAAACAFAEPALQPLTRETLRRVVIPPVDGKTENFDEMALDQQDHRLFLADDLDQGIDVVDVSIPPGHYLQTIQLEAVPHGIEYESGLHRLVTGNDNSTVSVIDADPLSPHPYAVLANINTGGKGAADLLDYDAKDRKLYVTNPDDGILSAIDLARNEVVDQVPNLGYVEQPRYNSADGMVYVISADHNSVIQVNPRTDKMVREYPLPVVCDPHGLAINPAIDQGLIGCGDKDNLVTLLWDFAAKRTIRSFDLAGGGDAVIFDQKAQHFYFAAKDFNPPEIAVFNAAPVAFLTAVPITSRKSHSVSYDEAHNLIYTYDGKHLEAALWVFPDPVAGCFGAEAQRASAGAPRNKTPHCNPKSDLAARR